MSDTPETDHIENNLGNAAHPILSSFCRKLERERDEARATCSELVTDSNAVTLAQTVVRITQERDEVAGYVSDLCEDFTTMDAVMYLKAYWHRNEARMLNAERGLLNSNKRGFTSPYINKTNGQ